LVRGGRHPGIAMSCLDSSIANIALPSIGARLINKAASIWVINAYQISDSRGVLRWPPWVRLSGYRRVSQCGMVVFTLASLGLRLLQFAAHTDIARVIQGLARPAS